MPEPFVFIVAIRHFSPLESRYIVENFLCSPVLHEHILNGWLVWLLAIGRVHLDFMEKWNIALAASEYLGNLLACLDVRNGRECTESVGTHSTMYKAIWITTHSRAPFFRKPKAFPVSRLVHALLPEWLTDILCHLLRRHYHHVVMMKYYFENSVPL